MKHLLAIGEVLAHLFTMDDGSMPSNSAETPLKKHPGLFRWQMGCGTVMADHIAQGLGTGSHPVEGWHTTASGAKQRDLQGAVLVIKVEGLNGGGWAIAKPVGFDDQVF